MVENFENKLNGIGIPDVKNLKNGQAHEEYLKKHYFEFWEFIQKEYPNIKEWDKKLKLFKTGISEKNICELQIIEQCEILVPNYQYLISSHIHLATIKEKYPEFCKFLKNKYPEIINLREQLYLWFNNLKDSPKCEICGKPTQYKSPSEGYNRFCCKECRKKAIVEETKQTKLKRYNNSGYTNTKKFLQTWRHNFQKDHPWIINWDENGNWICRCPHPECNKCQEKCFISDAMTWHDRNKYNVEQCTIIHPKKSKFSGFEVLIRNMYKNLNISCTFNRRNIISGLEIDIVPDNYKIVAEINGSYIHSILHKKINKDSHINKHLKCLEKNLELIYIWEDWELNDIEEFLKRKYFGGGLNYFKNLWFPDLKDDEWPLDLGWYDNIPTIENSIKEHFCYHQMPNRYPGIKKPKYPCFDSGIIKIT